MTSRTLAAMLALLLVSAPSNGQTPPRLRGATDVALRRDLMAGMLALRDGKDDLGIARLEKAFQRDPAHVVPGVGTAAYWLARAYDAQDSTLAAGTVLRAGVERMESYGVFDVQLADAFVRHVFTHRRKPDYVRAAAEYLALLAHLAADTSGVDPDVAAWILEPLLFVMNEADRTALGFEKDDLAGSLMLKRWTTEKAARVASWWWRRDVFPATERNERLEEHLERVAYAWLHYRKSRDERNTFDDETAFDARGPIYIRLGEPLLTRDLNLSVQRRELDRRGTMAAGDFPVMQIWTYQHIDKSVHYLFVKRPGFPFAESSVIDAIPSNVRARASLPRPVGSVTVDYGTAGHLQSALTYLYEKLALAHDDYGYIYEDLLHTDTASLSPSARIQMMMRTYENMELEMVNHREQVVPQAYTNLTENVPALPVEHRLARFLDDDGATRTEVYWTFATDDLAPTDNQQETLARIGQGGLDDYLVRLTAAQQRADYTTRAFNETNYPVDGTPAPIETTTLLPEPDTTGLFHVALQWDEYLTEPIQQAPGYRTRGQLRLTTLRHDSLTTLSTDPAVLEMSDLKPVIPSGDGGYAAYPFQGIRLSQSPLLYFEVYHLAYGADDRTHYTVALEVRSTDERFLLKDQQNVVSAQTQYSGDRRRAAEHTGIDLSRIGDADRVEVVVRVTDDVSGQAVARKVAFRVQR